MQSARWGNTRPTTDADGVGNPDAIPHDLENLMSLQSNYGDLPEAFAMRGEDGMIDQIIEPCYQCLSPQYLGDTWYDEGEIIVTAICPNYELRPLNKRALENMHKWLDGLPQNGVKLSIEDTVEAAMRLREHPQAKEMTHEQLSEFVTKLAIKMKEKRDGADGGLTMPPVSGNEARRAGARGAPAMANTRFTDPTMQSPGMRDRAVLHEPRRGAPVASRVKAPLTNAPPAAGR